jgi:nucleotide-binding universal stress UspA family protein
MPQAVSLATALDARIEVLQAVPPDGRLPSALGAEAMTGPTVQAKTRAEKYVEDVAERIRGEGVVQAGPAAVMTEPATAIINAAREAKDAVIVMSTHGRTGMGRWIRGSVADRVLRHADRPVLLVRP